MWLQTFWGYDGNPKIQKLVTLPPTPYGLLLQFLLGPPSQYVHTKFQVSS